mmetsp:Transcript_21338/g.34507  ORF Transcript_21338/g.34507 Transcript_21338/m.34507 type:complete len:428 (+) Transcript_21338:37-1320(+)
MASDDLVDICKEAKLSDIVEPLVGAGILTPTKLLAALKAENGEQCEAIKSLKPGHKARLLKSLHAFLETQKDTADSAGNAETEEAKKKVDGKEDGRKSLSTGDPSFLSESRTKMYRKHRGKVYALDWVDNDRLASAAQDGKAVVVNVVTGENEKVINLSSSWVMAVGASPNGKRIATGGLDNMVTVRDEDHDESIELKGHQGYISCIKFESDVSVWSCSGDKTIRKYDCDTKTNTATLEGHSADVMSIDIDHQRGLIVSGGCDHTVKIWGMQDGKCVKSLSCGSSDINSVTFAKEAGYVAAVNDGGELFVYDKDYKALIEGGKLKISESSCNSVAISSNGKMVYVGCSDSKVVAYNVESGEVQTLMHETDRISKVSISPDGASLAIASWSTCISICSIREDIVKKFPPKGGAEDSNDSPCSSSDEAM